MFSCFDGDGVSGKVKKPYLLFALPALSVIVLDQITKLLVVRAIRIHETCPVIDGFFNLVHVRNRGMAFGLMNRPDMEWGFYLLTGTTLGAVLLLIFWFTRLKDEERKWVLTLSLIVGGALGNLVDRLRLREVVDFFDFYIGTYHWPAFNVADSAITVGTFWLALKMFSSHPPRKLKLERGSK
jgi:signal peptidase II